LDDFDIMSKIGIRAWVLCLYMRLCCDQNTLLCKISQLEIHRKLGWNERTTRRSLKTLVENGYIVPQVHLIYKVRPWRRLSTDSVKSTESPTRYKVPSNSVESTESTRHKIPTNSVQSTDSYNNTESEKQNQRENLENLPVDKLKTGSVECILKTVGQENFERSC
jgi:hypothetical protein